MPDEPDDVVRRLSGFVEGEARRVLSEEQFEADPKLIADGWERRFMTDGRRVDEAVATYEELGFEVLAVPVRAEEFKDDCEDCKILMQLRFQTIYTRKKRTVKR